MSYNLIHEPWIQVIDTQGQLQTISLTTFFENVSNYETLAGEVEFQNFALLRLLLALTHSALDQYTLEGTKRPHSSPQDLLDDWLVVWESHTFPLAPLKAYLTQWENRFDLFHPIHPFYQIPPSLLESFPITKSKPTKVTSLTFNRTINQSANKENPFRPHTSTDLSLDALTRWLITYQSYAGVSDKAKFQQGKAASTSAGWPQLCGSLYLKGSTLFETLWLNLIVYHPQEAFQETKQVPVWELDPETILQAHLSQKAPDNLAALYTRWARALWLDQDLTLNVIGLPKFENTLIEPMTLWRFDKETDLPVPKRHRPHQALWRSYGFLFPQDTRLKPGIITWLEWIKPYLDETQVTLQAIGIEDDHKATCQWIMQVLSDTLSLPLTLIDSPYIPRIKELIAYTQVQIDKHLGWFLKQLATLRKQDPQNLKGPLLTQAYYALNQPFQEWLLNLPNTPDFEQSVKDWKKQVQRTILETIKPLIKSPTARDLNQKETNLAILYNQLTYQLRKDLDAL